MADMSGASHKLCAEAGKHICQRPSGQSCVEPGCDRPAGTWWGPLWCPEHDEERLDRISRQLAEIKGFFGGGALRG